MITTSISCWLRPSPVKEIRAVGLPILSASRYRQRAFRIPNPDAWRTFTPAAFRPSASANCAFSNPDHTSRSIMGRQDVLVFSVGDDAGDGCQPSVNPQIQVGKPSITAEEPLVAEIQSFLHCVRDPQPTPVVSLEDGARALELAWRFCPPSSDMPEK